MASSRAFIVRGCMALYAAALVFYFALLVVEALQSGSTAAASDRALDAIKILVLPIVTLMLGYYLSRR